MRRLDRGDTIIEVVLAFAIFTVAAMGTITIINSGLATTQRDLEVTLVRQQIDTQAELLRYLRDTDSPAWDTIIAPGALVANPLPLDESCQPNISGVAGGFYVRPVVNAIPADSTFARQGPLAASNFTAPLTYAKIDYSAGANQSEGIWIQATHAQNSGTVAAYDFYIHACWDSVGLDTPMTLGTIVRIYD